MEKVKDVMFKEVITVKRCTNLQQIIHKFARFHTPPLVPVVEEDNTLVGIIAFKDLIDILKPNEPEILKTIPFLDEKPIEISEIELSPEMGQLVVAEDIMNTEFLAINEEASVEEALRFMRLHDREQFPVINEEKKLKGVIGIFDIVMRIFKDRGIF
jgi:Mg/Co/Ni transporter MgtE